MKTGWRRQRRGIRLCRWGPLAEIQVEGKAPGSRVALPSSDGTVNVTWEVASVRLPIDQVEIVVGGLTHEQVNVDKGLSASGSAEVRVEDSTWIALRVRGSYKGEHGENCRPHECRAGGCGG